MKIVKNQLFFGQSLLLAASLLLVTGVLMVMSYHDFIKLLNKNLGQTSQSSNALIEIRIGTSTTITTEVVMVVGIPCVDILTEGKAASCKDKKDPAPIIEICSKVRNLDGNDIEV